MMDFSTLRGLTIPEGPVKSLAIDGKTVWNRRKFSYVSLGDSIAAGHSINSNWATDYGEGSQFESNGRTETVIVPNCYTDLIKNKLASIYKGEEHIKCKSFAHSGYTPDDIMRYIGYTPNEDGTFSVNENSPAVKALKEADLVTICVGANVLLLPAFMFVFNCMGDFVQNGDFTELENVVDAGLKTLNGGGYSKVEVDWCPKPFEFKYSYKELLTALTSINPNAKFVFTSIYNPLKYLHLEGGKNGSFKGLLNIIPQMTVLGIEVDEFWKSVLASFLTNFTKYINTIADWTEEHVEGSATYDGLNKILRKAIDDFGSENIVLAETKSFYESFPDRPISADVHYNDLINQQITAGYNLGDMHWGRIWDAYGKTREQYWKDLITKYGTNTGGIAVEFIADFSLYVLPYYMDPHPLEIGHVMLARSFADTIKRKFNIDLGYPDLVHYNLEYNPNTSNGGAGEAEITEIIGLNSEIFVPIKKLKFTTLSAQEGYYFTDWRSANYGYASGYYDVEGNLLNYYIKPTSNDTLTAQWSNMYTVEFYKTFDDDAKNYANTFLGGIYNNSGVQELYGVYRSDNGGANYTTLDTKYYRGNFTENGYINELQVPYGTYLKVWVTYDSKYASTTCYVFRELGENDETLASGSPAEYPLKVTNDTKIDFSWRLNGIAGLGGTSKWNCWISS